MTYEPQRMSAGRLAFTRQLEILVTALVLPLNVDRYLMMVSLKTLDSTSGYFAGRIIQMYHFSFSLSCPSQITMWDLQSGKLLRTIIDAHPLGSAVLHVMVCNERRF